MIYDFDNSAVIGPAHAQCQDDGGALNRGGDSETCAACCREPQAARRLNIRWVDHAFAVAVVPASCAAPRVHKAPAAADVWRRPFARCRIEFELSSAQ